MEEQNSGNMEIEQKTVPVGEAMPVATPDVQPVEMPAPAPTAMPEPVMPASPAQPMQPAGGVSPIVPEVERMQMPIQTIDLSGQSEMPLPTATPEEGDKKKLIIVAGVIIAVLVVGVGAFFAWRMMDGPSDEVQEVGFQAPAPIEVPSLPAPGEQIVIPAAPEMDDLSVIEQELNMFNAATLDAELQNDLNGVSGAL